MDRAGNERKGRGGKQGTRQRQRHTSVVSAVVYHESRVPWPGPVKQWAGDTHAFPTPSVPDTDTIVQELRVHARVRNICESRRGTENSKSHSMNRRKGFIFRKNSMISVRRSITC